MKRSHRVVFSFALLSVSLSAKAQDSPAPAAEGRDAAAVEDFAAEDAAVEDAAVQVDAALDAPEQEVSGADAGVPPPLPVSPEPVAPRDAGVAIAIDAGVSTTAEDYRALASVQRPAGPGELEPYGTGSRLNIPLRELPATVTLVDQETLRERGVVDLQQALGLMPGVMPTWQYGGFQNIRVRGFQAITLFDGRRDPRALVADSAPQVGIYDVERFELLRGPSSTLYGYGAVGGVVNVIRKRPSRQPLYELELGYGLPKQYRAYVGAQGAIGPSLSYRVDLGHTTREDYRAARTQRSQGSLALSYAPSWRHTANLRFAYAYDRYNTDVGIPSVESTKRPGRWVLPPDVRRDRRYGTRNDHIDYQRLEAALDYRLMITKATYLDARAAITRDRYEYLAAESLTYVPASGDTPALVDRGYLFFARGWLPVVAQLELKSDFKTGPLAHRALLGYQLESFTGKSDRGNVGGVAPGSVEFVYPVDRAPRVSALQHTSYDHYDLLTHALYAFDHIKLLEPLILTGGARLDAYKSRTRREFVDRYSDDAIPDPASGMIREPNRTSRVNVTGQVGLVYTPIEPLTGYASYASSFMPQVVYPSATSVVDYEPERGSQFEGGLRLRGARKGHLVELDGAGYFIEKRNVVIPRGPDEFSQAGKVVSRGMDLSLRYRGLNVIELDAGYSLTFAKYKEYVSTDPVTGEDQSRDGNQVDFAPRHGGTAWLRLKPLKRAGLGVGTRCMGKQFADPENRVLLAAYATLDATIWVGTERVMFTLNANNLLDYRSYITSVINTYEVNPQLTPGPGREILGTVRLTL